MNEIINRVRKSLDKHANVSICFGTITKDQISALRDEFKDYEVTKEFFGYIKFKKIKNDK